MSIVYLEKRDVYSYPKSDQLYAPEERYPEYPFAEITESGNPVYDMVRQSLIGLGLDKENFGTPEWNPLGDIITPGDCVVLKPNLVKHCENESRYECTVTHPSVIKPLIDYCIIAKAGRIILGDAPIQGADMEQIKKDLKINELIEYYTQKDVQVEFIDFRNLVVVSQNGILHTVRQKTEDENDFTTVHLGKKSKHYSGKPETYQICGYVDDQINRMHNEETHDYVISSHILAADVIINIPKPKTHRFAGLTGAQKNFVGSCSDKESLPHFKAGAPCCGGDETDSTSFISKQVSKYYKKYLISCKKEKFTRAKFEHLLYCFFERIKGKSFFTHGAWYGNDTIWRTIIDLNKIMYFADKQGNMIWGVPQRKIITIGDMIVSGQKDGPLEPTAKELGVVLASTNCAIFDYVFCKITGFDEKLIPTMHHSVRNTDLSIEDWQNVVLSSNDEWFDKKRIVDVITKDECRFMAHPFWEKVL